MPPELARAVGGALCPHCRRPFSQVGWITSPDGCLRTVYHADPDCMTVISCQFVSDQPRIALPGDMRPRGHG
jgi:hypothetical protein